MAFYMAKRSPKPGLDNAIFIQSKRGGRFYDATLISLDTN